MCVCVCVCVCVLSAFIAAMFYLSVEWGGGGRGSGQSLPLGNAFEPSHIKSAVPVPQADCLHAMPH